MIKKKTPKVAFIHDYLLQYGGAEKTLEALLEIFPGAPVFTGLYSPKNLPATITKREVKAIKNPLIRKFSKQFTFIMPLIFENFDLKEFDIIISDSSCWAKGVITHPDQLHISYIHTPPRFLYKYSVESPKRFKWYYKPIVSVLDHFLRIWDYCAGQRPDYLVTNSHTTQSRIKKFYGRESIVINPPLDIEIRKAVKSKNNIQKPFYCSLGRLAAYKNNEILIEAFKILGWDLMIMGTGTEEKKLKKIAENYPNIKVLGKVSEKRKAEILSECKGLIFPVVEEDWGIVPLEAMMKGKPVLAHKSGGATETVKENITGMFFKSLRLENFVGSIRKFDDAIDFNKFDKEKIISHAKEFTKDKFKKSFKTYVKEKWEEHIKDA